MNEVYNSVIKAEWWEFRTCSLAFNNVYVMSASTGQHAVTGYHEYKVLKKYQGKLNVIFFQSQLILLT